MKKIFTSLAALITAIMVVIITDYDKAEKQSEAWVEPTTISTTDDVTTETSVTTSTTSTTTTTTTTTDTTSSTSTTTTSTISITTTTSTTTTTVTTVATIEYIEIEEEYIEETVLVEEEYQTDDTVTEEEIYYEETQSNMTINYTINELTYYSGPSGCCGRWGRILLNNYSVASNLLPDGTIVHIESSDGSIYGDYRVDDTGGMGNNVIDIFYTDYANVPYPFSRDGRISCTAWVYE